jgi:hypothetical protein
MLQNYYELMTYDKRIYKLYLLASLELEYIFTMCLNMRPDLPKFSCAAHGVAALIPWIALLRLQFISFRRCRSAARRVRTASHVPLYRQLRRRR